MRSGLAVDQLYVGLNPFAHEPHAAFKHIADAELASDLSDIGRFSFLDKRCCPDDYEAVCDARQVRGQVVGYRVDEIFLLGIIRWVRKRQDDNR